MGLLDKAKAAAEQAAAKAKEGVEDVQTKRELGQAYNELGKAAFALVEGGEISHPRLQELAQKVRTLEERTSGDETVADSASNGASDSHDPSQPPAMPT
jgi:hypothetical protein